MAPRLELFAFRFRSHLNGEHREKRVCVARSARIMSWTEQRAGTGGFSTWKRALSKGIVPTFKRASAGNGLLAALPVNDRLHLVARSAEVPLTSLDVLYEPGERIRHVYFPTAGYISLLAAVDGARRLESGLVGREGMIGLPLALGVDVSTFRVLVQGAGSAVRMDAAAFGRELAQCAALRTVLNLYVGVLMAQSANAVACNHFHFTQARLARWLLMTQDRARSDAFYVTRELLSQILGVRRERITKCAASLQQLGLISYRRGNLTILDRAGLDSASCGCYRADLQTYENVLG